MIGSFVRIRGRRWLIERDRETDDRLGSLRLEGLDDDAQSPVMG